MALTRNQVSEIRLRLANGEKGCDLAKEFGVSNAYISQIKSHKKGMRQVWLTAEEAKRVQSALYELLRNSNDKNSKEWLTYWMINGRIEQAEDKG